MGLSLRTASLLLATLADGYRVGEAAEDASMLDADADADAHAQVENVVYGEDEFHTNWGSCGGGVFHFDLRSDENHSVALEFVRGDSQAQILSFVGYSWNARLTDSSLKLESGVTWTPEPDVSHTPPVAGSGEPFDASQPVGPVDDAAEQLLQHGTGEDVLLGLSHVSRIPAAPQTEVCATCHSADAIEFVYKDGTKESFSGGVYYPEDIVQRSIAYGSMRPIEGGISPDMKPAREEHDGGTGITIEDMIGRADARCLRRSWCLSYSFNPDQNLCTYRCSSSLLESNSTEAQEVGGSRRGGSRRRRGGRGASCRWRCTGPKIYYFDEPADPVALDSSEFYGPEPPWSRAHRGYEPTLVASWISGGFLPASVRESGVVAGADYHQRFLDTRSSWGWRGFTLGTMAALVGPALLGPEVLAVALFHGVIFGGGLGALSGLGLHGAVDPAAAEAMRQERRLNAVASETLFEQMRCSPLFVRCSPLLLVPQGETCPELPSSTQESSDEDDEVQMESEEDDDEEPE